MNLLHLNPLRLKLDTLHCALLVAIVLLAVYAFGSLREGNSDCSTHTTNKSCTSHTECLWYPQKQYEKERSGVHSPCKEKCTQAGVRGSFPCWVKSAGNQNHTYGRIRVQRARKNLPR